MCYISHHIIVIVCPGLSRDMINDNRHTNSSTTYTSNVAGVKLKANAVNSLAAYTGSTRLYQVLSYKQACPKHNNLDPRLVDR